MFVTDWFTFASLPRCGSDWFLKTMKRVGIPYVKVQGLHMMGREAGKPSITIHRDPATWLASWWVSINARLDNHGIPGFADMFILRMPGDTFEQYVERYIERMPGTISQMFGHYRSDHVIHTETLAQDFISLMQRLSVPCELANVRAEPENMSNNKPVLSDALRDAIRETEGRTSSPAQTLSCGFTS